MDDPTAPVLGPRFWKFVQPGEGPDPCWLWTGALRRGYGTFWLNGRNTAAHVLAYRALVGPIPEGYEVDHFCHDPERCDKGENCPHRACVNPDHLSAQTARDNSLRSGSPAARFARASHCKNGHEFTEENTYYRPNGGRTCRACRDANHHRYRPLASRRSDFDTHCVSGHEWTPENTYVAPAGERHCRTCARIRARRRPSRAKC